MSRSSAWTAPAACLMAVLVSVSPRAEADCGDGIIDEGEDCDDGVDNGGTECGCRGNCSMTPPHVLCGDTRETDCDYADSCDGIGHCDARHAADDTPCLTDGLFCTGVESCAGGLCLSPGNPCDAQTETCAEDLEMCVGLSDLIFADGFQPGDALAAPTTVP